MLELYDHVLFILHFTFQDAIAVISLLDSIFMKHSVILWVSLKMLEC